MSQLRAVICKIRIVPSHVAIQEKLNGSPVDWLEHVTEE
jgi:hypothetical protein